MDAEFGLDVRRWAASILTLPNSFVEEGIPLPQAHNVQRISAHMTILGTINTHDDEIRSEEQSQTSESLQQAVIPASGVACESIQAPFNTRFNGGVELPLRTPIISENIKTDPCCEDDENAVLPLCAADPWDDDRLKEAELRIREQGDNVSEFWRESYKTKAAQYWHQFYKRNADNFYKDRHYLHVEFPELLEHSDAPTDGNHRLQLLEVGCGVGNAITPLLELNANLYVHAFDFARSAIAILQQHPSVSKYPGRLLANTCNVITEPLPLSPNVQGQLDVVLCMFVLSAISPEMQLGVLHKLAAEMRVGAHLLFRDYGRYDEAQLRFKKGSKLQDNLYVRSDGTLAYYFELNELISICSLAGLVPVQGRSGYMRMQQANRGQGKARHRVFVQAVFEKVN